MSSAPVPFRRPTRTPVSCSVRSFDGTLIAYDLYDEGSRSAVLVIPGVFQRDDPRHVDPDLLVEMPPSPAMNELKSAEAAGR